MKKTKSLWQLLAILFTSLVLSGSISANKEGTLPSTGRIVVAYVCSEDAPMPDPFKMTHINYAFGDVNETFNGVKIKNEKRLRQLAALKSENKQLKVLLSIGGWGSGRFSEMAADSLLREAFVQDCKRIVDEIKLDGIDIDWEYPTAGAGAGISYSPDDTRNYTFLMRDLRRVLGQNKLLTLASVASAEYIDFKAVLPYVDFVNIMSYDMANAPLHHSPLYTSKRTGAMSCDKAVKAHLDAGVPVDRLTLGMAFYGRGGENALPTMNYADIAKAKVESGCSEQWDDVAKVPYLANGKGEMMLGYDNPESLALKCQYIVDNGLLGGMYWHYDADSKAGTLQETVRDCLLTTDRR